MANNKWKQPKSPPPPLFLGKKERDLTKQVNDELIERVIGQTIVYFPLDIGSTNYHPLYGEAINKEFGHPIVVKALIKIEADQTTNEIYGLDKESRLTINFHKRRLTEDQNLFVREGDIVFYGTQFYEIMKLSEPRTIFGQVDHKIQITANCLRVREGTFYEPVAALQVREAMRQTQQDIEDIINNIPPVEDEGVCGGKIQIISGKRTSSQRAKFLNYAQNPQNFSGCVVYLTEVDNDELYGEFNKAKKFYFNENGIWHASHFYAV